MASKTKALPPIATIGIKEVTFSADDVQVMKDDMKALEELGFEVPGITVQEGRATQYTLKPPDKPMGEWRQSLETSGFDVVSRLNPEQLGFAASRRMVQGKGWQ